jgi:glycosyltransferase involved in cell wall biosynthesis
MKAPGDILKLKKHYSIDKDQIVIGTIAPFKSQKGLFHLIKIAELVLRQRDNVIFFIAGDGKLRPKLENELKERKIFKYFRLPGFLFDIAPVIDIFDIGLSTALWEGLPQSLIQLRLKKKPLVASNISGNNEVVLQAKNGFLAELPDYKKFSDHLIDLIDNPKLRQDLGNYTAEDFSEWDAKFMVKAQENLYKKLIKTYTENNYEN